MIILDASVVVELLIHGPLSEVLRRDLAESGDAFSAPCLLDVEVVSALRNLVAGGRVDSYRSNQLLQDLSMLPVERYPHGPLLERVWQLRHNFTAYDGVYIALAEQIDGVLYTADEKLAKGHRARVRVFRQAAD